MLEFIKIETILALGMNTLGNKFKTDSSKCFLKTLN